MKNNLHKPSGNPFRSKILLIIGMITLASCGPTEKDVKNAFEEGEKSGILMTKKACVREMEAKTKEAAETAIADYITEMRKVEEEKKNTVYAPVINILEKAGIMEEGIAMFTDFLENGEFPEKNEWEVERPDFLENLSVEDGLLFYEKIKDNLVKALKLLPQTQKIKLMRWVMKYSKMLNRNVDPELEKEFKKAHIVLLEKYKNNGYGNTGADAIANESGNPDKKNEARAFLFQQGHKEDLDKLKKASTEMLKALSE